MTFEELALNPSILKAIVDSGYTEPTPIQAQAIPQALAGHDLVASARTGSGKTAAFVLPSLHRLTTPATGPGRGPRVLVLTPTRELANQVTEAAAKYGKHLRFRIGSIVGGVAYPPQMRLLSQPLDILVATPGRLLDHMESKRVDFSRLEVLVLDEADRMLDMGFIHAVEKIVSATPANRQTLLFSATLDGDVAKLTHRMLKNPQRIQIASATQRHEDIEQRLHHVDGGEHKQKLLSHLLEDVAVEKAIVFTATKRGADRLAKRLHAQGHPAGALHGNMNQNQRNRAMLSLRSGKVRLLVATDVAARGLDVNGITHVFNYDLPKNPEDYVHRIGRTGRAGAKGIAVSFAAPEDRGQLRDIERYIKQAINVLVVEGFQPTRSAPSRDQRGEQRRDQPRHRQNEHRRPGGEHRKSSAPRPHRGSEPRRGDEQPRGGEARKSSGYQGARRDHASNPRQSYSAGNGNGNGNANGNARHNERGDSGRRPSHSPSQPRREPGNYSRRSGGPTLG